MRLVVTFRRMKVFQQASHRGEGKRCAQLIEDTRPDLALSLCLLALIRKLRFQMTADTLLARMRHCVSFCLSLQATNLFAEDMRIYRIIPYFLDKGRDPHNEQSPLSWDQAPLASHISASPRGGSLRASATRIYRTQSFAL